MSNYVTLTGADLEYFKGIVGKALSGDFGDITEVRVVFNGDSMCLGANGYSSEWLGEKPYETEGNTEPESVGDIVQRVEALEAIAEKAKQYL